ncbi:MAG: hypothetical protein [Circular genetic element sp.]|nr:MAG: hypothetical protein [Circular genetic element sp.]
MIESIRNEAFTAPPIAQKRLLPGRPQYGYPTSASRAERIEPKLRPGRGWNEPLAARTLIHNLSNADDTTSHNESEPTQGNLSRMPYSSCLPT